VVENSADLTQTGQTPLNPSQDLAWYAVHVRSQAEKKVTDSLSIQGHECLLPTYREKRKWSDRTKILELPLFPGYVFIRFDVRRRLPILKTTGVLGILGTGPIPQALDPAEIARIQTVTKTGFPAQPWPFLKTGQKVRITAGPLSGIEGLLVALRGQARVVLSVTELGRSIAVQVDSDAVRPV
jgi:transcription antitermination factor NusG